jgi:hypothetical protein
VIQTILAVQHESYGRKTFWNDRADHCPLPRISANHKWKNEEASFFLEPSLSCAAHGIPSTSPPYTRTSYGSLSAAVWARLRLAPPPLEPARLQREGAPSTPEKRGHTLNDWESPENRGRPQRRGITGESRPPSTPGNLRGIVAALHAGEAPRNRGRPPCQEANDTGTLLHNFPAGCCTFFRFGALNLSTNLLSSNGTMYNCRENWFTSDKCRENFRFALYFDLSSVNICSQGFRPQFIFI